MRAKLFEGSDSQINSRLAEEFSQLVTENEAIEFGRSALLIDRLFAFRILLGRMPQPAELAKLDQQSVVYRDFLNSLLNGDEFRGRFDFMPADTQFMSEVNGFRFWFDSSDREMGAKMAAGLYEPEMRDIFRKFVKPGMRCLDIGAQTGFYTCVMASLVGDSGKVIAYEPFAQSYKLLQKNVSENRWEGRVQANNVAVSDSNTEIRAGIASGMIVADKNGSNTIKSVRLDDMNLDSIDFCKIDIEGHEPEAVRGMEKLLLRDSPVLLTEVNEYWLSQAGSSSTEYLTQLRDLQYELYGLEDRLYKLANYTPNNPLENINIAAFPRHQVDYHLANFQK